MWGKIVPSVRRSLVTFLRNFLWVVLQLVLCLLLVLRLLGEESGDVLVPESRNGEKKPDETKVFIDF